MEFVVIDDGTETDWIDPVVSVDENEICWIVHNGYHAYVIDKKPGRSIQIRPKWL